jgi:SAM-dependent methyltransferase
MATCSITKLSIAQYHNRMTDEFPRRGLLQDPRIAFFDHHAPTWDQTGPNPISTLQRLNELKAKLGLRTGMDVLEVGCGTGLVTGWLAEMVRPGKVLAIDFSPEMLMKARERRVEAEFALADICRAEPLPFRQFDLVLCFNSFPHFRDQPTALRQMSRHLKPGGRVTVLHLAGSDHLNAFHHQVGGAVGHDFLPPAKHWSTMAENAGLRLTLAEDQSDLFLVQAEGLPNLET